MEWFECTRCWVWGWKPEGFIENKHFAKCPKCNKPAYRAPIGSKPEEIGLKEKNKVEMGTMPCPKH